MRLKVLGSSSAGNCYILTSITGSLLIECGLTWKEIQKGFDFDLSGVVGCLVSHEHKDHCRAAKEVMNAGIDVYLSEGTAVAIGVCGHRVNTLTAGKQRSINDFIILPFDTEHDCSEPLGFLIQYRPTGEKTLFLTDSYYSKYRFKGLNYVFIESNYCKDILNANIEAGLVDEGMKRRLLESHMSLENCNNFLSANDLSMCRQIVLLHLSPGNSDAGRMKRDVEELTGINTVVAEPGLTVGLELYPY